MKKFQAGQVWSGKSKQRVSSPVTRRKITRLEEVRGRACVVYEIVEKKNQSMFSELPRCVLVESFNVWADQQVVGPENEIPTAYVICKGDFPHQVLPIGTTREQAEDTLFEYKKPLAFALAEGDIEIVYYHLREVPVTAAVDSSMS